MCVCVCAALEGWVGLVVGGARDVFESGFAGLCGISVRGGVGSERREGLCVRTGIRVALEYNLRTTGWVFDAVRAVFVLQRSERR